MDLMEKLTLLTGGAKYDAACTSSGADRSGPPGKGMGSAMAAGCCHSFAADGRCISLLKVLMTNVCIYDCQYCVNRRSNDVPRVTFTPEELAELTIQFYRRNYIEGLFLSSGVIHSPDVTMERMIRVLELLREKYAFYGYLHCKVIPGASKDLIRRAGQLADRLSVNIELPSERSLRLLCPDKTRQSVLGPMAQIQRDSGVNGHLCLPEHRGPGLLSAPRNSHELDSPGRTLSVSGHFSDKELSAGNGGNASGGWPRDGRTSGAGQATQMIIGATPESDFQILRLAQGLYHRYGLKRVFYSAYVPVTDNSLLPAPGTPPPLLREHRLYQADFLLRRYQFAAEELLSADAPNFHPYLDPKCDWALRHMDRFPLDVNRASREDLLRVPGVGPTSAARIVTARREGRLDTAALKRLGVVLKRAQYFLLTPDRPRGTGLNREGIVRALIDPGIFSFGMEQLSLFTALPAELPGAGDVRSLREAAEEATRALAAGF
ncbi:MAG: putative DNA modification/repair radical SAM protein [Oscillospiraceae bacterium]|nr:putative DNA modification/repair radical SAM protein [Oscillospiraceae bacterium]